MAALSTIFLTVNRLIALSFGTHLEQFEHLTGFTCPLDPGGLFLPCALRLTVMVVECLNELS